MRIKRHTSIQYLLVTLVLATIALAQSKPPEDYPRFEVIDLATFGGPNGNASANAISISREVVGISADCAFQATRGFYVKGDGPMVDIGSLIVRGPEVTPIQPVYISEKGEIVEQAAFANGELRTVLLKPTDDREGDGKDHQSRMSAKERARAAARINRGQWGLLRFGDMSRYKSR